MILREKPKLSSLYDSATKPVFSVEFFPPKTNDGLQKIKETLKNCSKLPVDCMTVTYGAGGGTSSFSQDLASYIQNSLPQIVVSHLTCFSHTQDELLKTVDELVARGITNILVLRGDKTAPDAESRSFSSATDFVKFLKNYSNSGHEITVAVAGYPEPHRESLGHDADFRYLKEKVDAGASIIYTQLFFEPEIFFKYQDDCKKYGIQIPIIPGVMPIFDYNQISKITSLCNVTFPDGLITKLERFKDDKAAMTEIGTSYAIHQIQNLLQNGVQGIHLYAFNKLDQIKLILEECSVS